VDLDRVVSDVLSDLDERIRTSKGRVLVGPLPTLVASPVQMRQLFQNLIANGLKFHADGVAPEVHVDRQGPERQRPARPRRGLGDHRPRQRHRLRRQVREKVFAPFQRLNGRQAFEGTGMGLAICRKIVGLCGGTISASSRLGAGSTFLITLPRVQAALHAVPGRP